MTTSRTVFSFFIGIVMISLTAAFAQLAGPGGFDLSWNSIDGGGGTSTGGGPTGFELTGTIGQPDASTVALTGGTFEVRGGFWPGGVTPVPDCPPDIAPQPSGDGLVNIDDLLLVINSWGPCGSPPCPADINHSGVIDIDDLLAVITGWGVCP